jgi:hypothetical protein
VPFRPPKGLACRNLCPSAHAWSDMSLSRSVARKAAIWLLGFTLVSTATACAGSSPATNASPATVTQTVTVTQTPTSGGLSSGASSTSASAGTSAAANSTTGGPLASAAAGRKLTLSDFFAPSSNWTEERFDIADTKNVTGIATPVQACYEGGAVELELRLGNNFSSFSFSVGQANTSLRSDQNVSVQVLGNNAQLDIESVPFNQVQSFTIPVAGVNALKIRMALDDKVATCGGSVIAVITDPVLT